MQTPRLDVSKSTFPAHSFLSHFPVGLWLTSFVLDVIVLVRPDQILLGQAATVLLWCGTISAIAAAIFGWRDYNTRIRAEHPEALQTARTHLSLNVFLIFWYAVLASLRTFGRLPFGSMTGLQFLMGAVGFGALIRSAMLGGKLVFMYRIGQVPGAETAEREAEARKYPEKVA